MKKYIILLLFLPIICFSQNRNTPAPVKPSSTDCPTWDSKSKPKNNWDYYRSLRSRKPMKDPDTSKNNYANSKPKVETKKANTVNIVPEKTEIKKDTLNVAKTEVKEKSKEEEEKTVKKVKRLPPRKTTKVRRKKTTGCPQF